mgnify:FL=1
MQKVGSSSKITRAIWKTSVVRGHIMTLIWWYEPIGFIPCFIKIVRISDRQINFHYHQTHFLSILVFPIGFLNSFSLNPLPLPPNQWSFKPFQTGTRTLVYGMKVIESLTQRVFIEVIHIGIQYMFFWEGDSKLHYFECINLVK